ncbi:hypothetical protein M8C21_023991 [Ambrosia artemisiifolia]|uniref:Uncharacterized protein n=1 Tax=Ambrosia artemisiifolia TaxID=4212 RepID=A0AAD5BMU3_AMBAR|nr:hypothetical protein M8C21_023991 [Ambrosia artemisiifolia]
MDVAVIDWKDSKFEKDILYEDFNAPQWIDFSNDDHIVDDEAWFCKPECDHPKTVEDFFRQKSPGSSSKLQRSASVSEIHQFGQRNRRDAALKKRGCPPKKDSKCSTQVHDSENQDPNFTTPPTHKSKSLKQMIKSSSEKNHGQNILSPTEETAKPRLLKSTLSAHNLFAGRDIFNQVSEFCNELKRLATGKKEGVVAASKQEVGMLMKSKSERKPLLEVKKEISEDIEKQSNVKEKVTGKQTNADLENRPISLNMKNIRGKDEARVLQQIRTNPPSPQCFSANRGTTKATPSKAFRLRPQERGMLQEIESMEVKKEAKVKGDNITTQNEAKGLDVFWLFKPCTLSS